MAAISDNKYDVYNWIIKVYDSVEDNSQLMTAENLARNFRKKYEDYELNSALQDYWIQTYNTLKDRRKNKQLLKG